LRQWIKNHHTTALTWNSQGGDAASFVGAAPSGGGSGGPPPPPGPPPPALDFTNAPPPSGGGGDSAHAALFAEINAVKERQKGGKTEGLRTVTKEMKTKYQDKSNLPAVAPKGSSPAPKKATQAPSRPPKFALEGAKWVVEFQVGNQQLVIDNPESRHTVYIYKCEESVVQIKGKVNAITMDGCKKVGVVFDNAISAVEIVNCNSVQVQCNGKVPSILVDKTSGAQLFLSNEGLDVEIVTSKSDEMNVVLPPLNPSDDITEIAIPEQFKTVLKNRKLVTECVAHV